MITTICDEYPFATFAWGIIMLIISWASIVLMVFITSYLYDHKEKINGVMICFIGILFMIFTLNLGFGIAMLGEANFRVELIKN